MQKRFQTITPKLNCELQYRSNYRDINDGFLVENIVLRRMLRGGLDILKSILLYLDKITFGNLCTQKVDKLQYFRYKNTWVKHGLSLINVKHHIQYKKGLPLKLALKFFSVRQLEAPLPSEPRCFPGVPPGQK